MKALILAQTSFGKTQSILKINKENLNNIGLSAENTLIISYNNKDLPIYGNDFDKKYHSIEFHHFNEMINSNLIQTKFIPNVRRIVSNNLITTMFILKYVENNLSNIIKNIVIDDFHYMISAPVAKLAKNKQMNWDKFSFCKSEVIEIMEIITSIKKLNIFCLAHYEEIDTEDGIKSQFIVMPSQSMKDVKIEGFFSNVFIGIIKKNDNNEIERKLLTKANEISQTAKSFYGMFEEYIPNDLGYILQKEKEYLDNNLTK